jgi:hypothetical protein
MNFHENQAGKTAAPDGTVFFVNGTEVMLAERADQFLRHRGHKDNLEEGS